jgi:catechol 2,3-dioxygenase-like lactoylglutathione lyase family enzyme
MPNLENLKKQAKLYLRWHREGYFPVAAQIRATLPCFEHLSDEAVLAHSFKLSDAQELIERKGGFESWEALLRRVKEVKGVNTMNDVQVEAASKPTLLAAEPQLFVSDVLASCEVYTKKLGFAVAFTYGEPAFYGQVFRDGARLNLRHLDEPAIRPELQEREHLLSASITVDDVKLLFLEFQAAGVEFQQTLKTEPWGARTFVVRDPDGNLVLFAGRGQ